VVQAAGIEKGGEALHCNGGKGTKIGLQKKKRRLLLGEKLRGRGSKRRLLEGCGPWKVGKMERGHPKQRGKKRSIKKKLTRRKGRGRVKRKRGKG